jgi:DNA-directed RNA polymerase specialized sigma24 family protein
MSPQTTPAEQSSLDALSRQALAGDTHAEAALYEGLRVRFLALAKRRVRQDSVEDVVQDALRIVHQKHREREQGRGILVWSLTVLRNVIGNYYQAKERRTRREVQVEDLELFASTRESGAAAARDVGMTSSEDDVAERIQDAVAVLAVRHPRCGTIFRRILESLDLGGGPREISQRALAWVRQDEPEMTAGTFYTALHRCRAHLREILATPEAGSGHE